VDQRTIRSGIEVSADNLSYSSEPFPHLALPAFLSPAAADQVLAWLQTDAPWRLRVESFYEQYEFSLISEDDSPASGELAGEKMVAAVRKLICEHFAVSGGLSLVDVSAHKLTSGQTIRIHNDWIGGEETHRFLIQLNDGWSIGQGGLLMLFASKAPDDVCSIIEPTHGSAFAFEISDHSFHAVSTIKSGERFTLVYTFCDRG